ncbi:Uncharacterised protein [Enterobacter hormaechei]|nr:Uncharacterised protein [Enterobacter hormaechei]STP60527.1 Uncharacterised protein [Enterobacter hormaechei]
MNMMISYQELVRTFHSIFSFLSEPMEEVSGLLFRNFHYTLRKSWLLLLYEKKMIFMLHMDESVD